MSDIFRAKTAKIQIPVKIKMTFLSQYRVFYKTILHILSMDIHRWYKKYLQNIYLL